MLVRRTSSRHGRHKVARCATWFQRFAKARELPIRRAERGTSILSREDTMRAMTCGLMILATLFGLVAGCGDAVVESGEGGGGNGGSAGANEGGTGNVSGCAKCGPDQHCLSCNSAGPPYNSCVDRTQPGAGEFECKWIACTIGDVCLDTQPAGDGCPGAECASVPAECASTPTCECIQSALGANGCTEDESGNITVSGYFF
jgi:hypothetical protein